MKHITPQAQNHIFKDKNKKNKKPVPFQETTGFITLEELKVLEKKGKFSMDSDSENDYNISSSFVDDANDKSTNDDLFTDGKETYEDEAEFQDIEEESHEMHDDINEMDDDINDEINDEDEEEISVNLELKRTSKKQKKFIFTMKYEQVEDTW